MKLLKKISKQYDLGPWVGGIKDIVARTMFYIGILSFVQISAAFYYLTLKPAVAQYVPWLSFWVYLLLLTLLVFLIMFLEYKFIVPSSFTFQNRQAYLHNNPIRDDLKEIKEKLEKLEERSLGESRNNSPSKTT